jgi:chaperonin cofactor prefoldin
MLQNLVCKVEWLLSEKGTVESELQDLLAQKGYLDMRLKDSESSMKELESRLQKEKFSRLYQLLGMLVLNLGSIHDSMCCAVMGHRTELRFLQIKN